jgi:aspartate-semialdehyde dehydrogenase
MASLKNIKLGIVGATGLVGRTILDVVLERKLDVAFIKLFASEKSAGSKIISSDREYTVEKLDENSFNDLDVALFSSGAYVSKKYVPIAITNNCIVIDNGSYWRLNKDIPLIVPEVNTDDIKYHKGIIANPNCSTIQLVIVLNALLKLGDIKRIVVSTYQAVSGAGQKGIDKYYTEMNGENYDDGYKIFNNVMFHSAFNDAGNTIEEEKILNETKKILGRNDFAMNVNCVRIPVKNSHCEFVNVEFADNFSLNQIKEIISNQEGIKLIDGKDIYPNPLMSNGCSDVLVGRVRKDNSKENAYNMWIVADNLRKGAATNAVQILEKLINKI